MLILFLAYFKICGQQFTLLQVNQINDEIKRLLQTFSKYSAFVPGESQTQEIPKEFQNLFQPDAQVLNFLDPDTRAQTPVSPTEYYQYIRKYYPSGLSFEIHWNVRKMSRLMPTDDQDTSYAGYLPVVARAIGLYNGQEINNISGEYYVIIGFRMKDGQVSNGVIHYIQAERPISIYVQKTDILFGPYVAPAFTRIHSRDIFTDEVWDAWGEYGYRAGLKVLFQKSKNFGFFSGAGISIYRSVYEIVDYNNENIAKTIKTDADGDIYYELIEASVTEDNRLLFFDIPLGIRYSIGGNKIRFAVQAGFECSFLLSSLYSVTGNSEHQGYYPDYHVVLYDLPDYGFTAEQIDISGKWKLNTFNLSANVTAGAEIYFNKNILLTVSPFVTAGLTDLGYELSRHRDDYISISGNPGKLSTRSVGILIELFMKL